MEKGKDLLSNRLPNHLKGCLWSYDLKQLDEDADFERIATNIMVYGDMRAIRWLLRHYSKEKITSVLLDPIKGEWDAKSLNFWSEYLQVAPDRQKALKAFTTV
ncbi:MAG: hypothetical protein GY866_28045 [Proteobacteria bacterium]|nr:hypothetical protein [Pseudomonadota bacterium]